MDAKCLCEHCQTSGLLAEWWANKLIDQCGLPLIRDDGFDGLSIWHDLCVALHGWFGVHVPEHDVRRLNRERQDAIAGEDAPE